MVTQFCWGEIQEGRSHEAFFNFPFPFTIRPLIFSSTGKLTFPFHVNCWQLYFTPGKTRAKRKEEKKQRPRTFLSNYISTEWSIFLFPVQSRQSPVNTAQPSWEMPFLAGEWLQDSAHSSFPESSHKTKTARAASAHSLTPKVTLKLLVTVIWRLNSTGKASLPLSNWSSPFPRYNWGIAIPSFWKKKPNHSSKMLKLILITSPRQNTMKFSLIFSSLITEIAPISAEAVKVH